MSAALNSPNRVQPLGPTKPRPGSARIGAAADAVREGLFELPLPDGQPVPPAAAGPPLRNPDCVGRPLALPPLPIHFPRPGEVRLHHLVESAPHLRYAEGPFSDEWLASTAEQFVRFMAAGADLQMAEVLLAWLEWVGTDPAAPDPGRYHHVLGRIVRAVAAGDQSEAVRWLRACCPGGLDGPGGDEFRAVVDREYPDLFPDLPATDGTPLDALDTAVSLFLTPFLALCKEAERRSGLDADGLPRLSPLEAHRRRVAAARLRADWQEAARECRQEVVLDAPLATDECDRLNRLVDKAWSDRDGLAPADQDDPDTDRAFADLVAAVVSRAWYAAAGLGLWEVSRDLQGFQDRAVAGERLHMAEVKLVLSRVRQSAGNPGGTSGPPQGSGGLTGLPAGAVLASPTDGPPPPPPPATPAASAGATLEGEVGVPKRNRRAKGTTKPVTVPEGWAVPARPRAGWTKYNVDPAVGRAIEFLKSMERQASIKLLAAMTGASDGLVNGSGPWTIYADVRGINRKRGSKEARPRTAGMIREADAEGGLAALERSHDTGPGAELEEEEVWAAILKLCLKVEDRRVLEAHKANMKRSLVRMYEQETTETFQHNLPEFIRSLRDNQRSEYQSPLT